MRHLALVFMMRGICPPLNGVYNRRHLAIPSRDRKYFGRHNKRLSGRRADRMRAMNDRAVIGFERHIAPAPMPNHLSPDDHREISRDRKSTNMTIARRGNIFRQCARLHCMARRRAAAIV